MTHRSFFVVFGLSIFYVASFTAFGGDDQVLDSKEEYRHIFKNIPVLFEYLLVALQDKPEILETDNIMAFADISKNNAKQFDKRDASSEKEVDDEKSGPLAKTDDEVEGLDDSTSDEIDDDKSSSNEAENGETELKITPQELAEKFIMVEQLLEDYNKT